jgi:hypothetical protein
MSAPSRRSFISWLGGLAAASGLHGAVRAEARPAPPVSLGDSAAQGTGLDPALLTQLAEAVLPGELGDIDTARVSRAFARWAEGYQPGAELNHPYGSATIRFAGASPVGRWRSQLDALQQSARSRFGRSFQAASLEQRRDLVQAALFGERVDRMPSPLSAGHVAIALLSWYFASPEATDLCYRARINPNSCRPLANAGREPLPLVRGS